MLTAAAGAVLGGLALRPLGRKASACGVAVAGANGALAGARGVYDWRRPPGVVAFVLDSTWAVITTGASLGVHGFQLSRPDRGNYRADLSERQGRHVYEGGLALKRGFAMAIGPAITNAGGRRGLDPSTARGRRRRRFVRDHEGLHVWQQRWFGPLFPAVYAIWMAGGAAVGTFVWLRNRGEGWYHLVETAAYYDNPFEYWAYRNDNHWRPSGAHPLLAWREPARADASR